MGWAFGNNHEGREIGYGVESVCEQEGCTEEIDLGLAFCCGDLPGVNGERGCGHYFCAAHLLYGEGVEGQRCGPCMERDQTEAGICPRCEEGKVAPGETECRTCRLSVAAGRG